MTTSATRPGPDAHDRLDDLVDRHEITGLVHRLGGCLDEGRFDGLRAIFTGDATASTPGGRADGLDAVVAQAGRNHSADDRIQHVITDVVVDLDGDRAAVRANLVVTFARGAGLPAPRRQLGEVYRFTARRTPAGWRLASVESTPVWHVGAIT